LKPVGTVGRPLSDETLCTSYRLCSSFNATLYEKARCDTNVRPRGRMSFDQSSHTTRLALRVRIRQSPRLALDPRQ
jgi:hypothetical protein